MIMEKSILEEKIEAFKNRGINENGLSLPGYLLASIVKLILDKKVEDAQNLFVAIVETGNVDCKGFEGYLRGFLEDDFWNNEHIYFEKLVHSQSKKNWLF